MVVCMDFFRSFKMLQCFGFSVSLLLTAVPLKGLVSQAAILVEAASGAVESELQGHTMANRSQEWSAQNPNYARELQQSMSAWHSQREVTRGTVYSAGQDLWFANRRKRAAPATPLGSALSTPLMDVDAAPAGLGSTSAASNHTTSDLDNPPLLNPMPIEEEAAYATTASHQGIDMNDEAAVQAWMGQPIRTRQEVLSTIRAYHVGVIRAEMYNIVAQVEQAITRVHDQVLRLQGNLDWMQSENRQSQKIASGLQCLLTGFPSDMDGEQRLFMINWMIGQMTEARTFLKHRGWTESDPNEPPYWWLNCLQQEPSTPPTSEGAFSSVSILLCKSWELRKAFLAEYGGTSGTPLWRDSRHVRASPASPQYQRKLELPIRVLLEVINHADNLPSHQVVILWRTLTVMSPQTERTFDEAATACARLHYYEEGHVFQGLLEVDESLHAAMTETPPAAWNVEEPTLWEWAWNHVSFGVQHEMDLAEKALFREKAKSAKGDGKGISLGKGARHYSAPLVYSSDMDPYPIPLCIRKVPDASIAYVWDDYCDKLKEGDQKCGDYKRATYRGRPGGPSDAATPHRETIPRWQPSAFAKSAPPRTS